MDIDKLLRPDRSVEHPLWGRGKRFIQHVGRFIRALCIDTSLWERVDHSYDFTFISISLFGEYAALVLAPLVGARVLTFIVSPCSGSMEKDQYTFMRTYIWVSRSIQEFERETLTNVS